MADGTGKGCKGHNEYAGTHSGFQLIPQHTGQDQQHHHAAACTDKPANKADHHTTDHRLYKPLFGVYRFHCVLGGHNRLYNKLNAEQECHKYRETAHRAVGHLAGNPAAHHGKAQNRYHHHNAVADVQIFVFAIGISADRAGQHIAGQCNAHSLVSGHIQKGNEHRADDRRRAHAGKAGAKARADAGNKAHDKFNQHCHCFYPPDTFPRFCGCAPCCAAYAPALRG